MEYTFSDNVTFFLRNMIIVVAFLKIILSTVDDEYHLKKIRNYDIELKKCLSYRCV